MPAARMIAEPCAARVLGWDEGEAMFEVDDPASILGVLRDIEGELIALSGAPDPLLETVALVETVACAIVCFGQTLAQDQIPKELEKFGRLLEIGSKTSTRANQTKDPVLKHELKLQALAYMLAACDEGELRPMPRELQEELAKACPEFRAALKKLDDHDQTQVRVQQLRLEMAP